MKRLIISGLVVFACFMTCVFASGPQWWIDRGVVLSNAVTNDYAAVNQGQVKHMAEQAASEFTEVFGSVSTEIDALVSGFSTNANYKPVNLGQLKRTAAPFYDQLNNSNMTNAWPEAMTAGPYPWSSSTNEPADFAIANIGQLKYLFSFDPSSAVFVDTDGDQISDNWELLYASSLDVLNGAESDYDNDGLSDRDEYIQGTHPMDADSDDDGLVDGLDQFPLDQDIFKDSDGDGVGDLKDAFPDHACASVDTDGDGLPDVVSHCTQTPALVDEISLGTDPLKFDTDGDGLDDLGEFLYGLNPLLALESELTADSDGDGVDNGYEVNNGMDWRNPDDALKDYDGDGLLNIEEFNLEEQTSAINADSDYDGMPDKKEKDYSLDPTRAMASELAVDSDGDGLPNGYELELEMDPFSDADASIDEDGDNLDAVTEYTLGTDPCDPDTDGDLQNDGDEFFAGRNPLISDESDIDGDGLSDRKENEIYGTNPARKDTDMDGINDGVEVQWGTNPLSADTDSDGIADIYETVIEDEVLESDYWKYGNEPFGTWDGPHRWPNVPEGEIRHFYLVYEVESSGIHLDYNFIKHKYEERKVSGQIYDVQDLFGKTVYREKEGDRARTPVVIMWPNLSCETSGPYQLYYISRTGQMSLIEMGRSFARISCEFTTAMLTKMALQRIGTYKNKFRTWKMSAFKELTEREDRCRLRWLQYKFRPGIRPGRETRSLRWVELLTPEAASDDHPELISMMRSLSWSGTDEETPLYKIEPDFSKTDGKQNWTNGTYSVLEIPTDAGIDMNRDGLINGQDRFAGYNPDASPVVLGLPVGLRPNLNDTNENEVEDRCELDAAQKESDPDCLPLHFCLPQELIDVGGSVELSVVTGSDAIRIWGYNENGSDPSILTHADSFIWTNQVAPIVYLEGIDDSGESIRLQLAYKLFITADADQQQIEDRTLGRIFIDINSSLMITDNDRNGVIDSEDVRHSRAGEPFRFWINDDNDDPDSEVSGDDLPGQFWADCKNDHVDGVRDLIDFFPVWLDISHIVKEFPASDYDYFLKHSTGAFNIMEGVQLPSEQAGSHLTNVNFCVMNAEAKTARIKAKGYRVPETVISAIENGERPVVFLEAREATSKPLVLDVCRRSTGDSVVKMEMPMSISSVEDMFLNYNLRYAAGGSVDIPSRTSASNIPSHPENRGLVFVHGYNVDEDSARRFQAETFKRLWSSGYNGWFSGIMWFGHPDEIIMNICSPEYHQAIVNAFASAGEVGKTIEDFKKIVGGPVDVIAHSAGNVVVSSAVQDHGCTFRNYIALDAAVPLEAYGSSAQIHVESNGFASVMNIDTGMISHASFDEGLFSGQGYSWPEYDARLHASEWYHLFEDSSDARQTLTWRNRFGSVGSGNPVGYNFYSGTEEVLRNYEEDSLNHGSFWDWIKSSYNDTPILPGEFDDLEAGEHFKKLYVWVKQEKTKGRKDNWLLPTVGGLPDKYAGWGFTQEGQFINELLWTVDLGPKSPEDIQVQINGSDSDAFWASTKTDPLFRRTPSALFNENSGSLMNEDCSDIDGLGDATPNASFKDWLLAAAFPATTWATGANFSESWVDKNNFDMSALYMTDQLLWPSKRYCRYKGIYRNEWHHGDFKDLAYVHIYKLFNKWVELTEE